MRIVTLIIQLIEEFEASVPKIVTSTESVANTLDEVKRRLEE